MSPEKYKKLLEAARSISKESIEEHINSLIKSREIIVLIYILIIC